MEGKLRNMTAIYLLRGEKVLLLYRQGGRVVNDVWTGSAGGHFEKDELNDAKACVLRELYEELGLRPEDIEGLALRYIALRNVKGEIRQRGHMQVVFAGGHSLAGDAALGQICHGPFLRHRAAHGQDICLPGQCGKGGNPGAVGVLTMPIFFQEYTESC